MRLPDIIGAIMWTTADTTADRRAPSRIATSLET
jgi:hypothetical protein